jgi:beta-N-acetylhexosaminidase
VTAFYALYSKGPAFVDTAAQLLFRRLTPTGDAPVSVPGVGYDIAQVTAPNPSQVIEIFYEAPVEAETKTPEPATFKQGDTLHLRTGVIEDRNGRAVPDGTQVNFWFKYEGESLAASVAATTTGGSAAYDYVLDGAGNLEITASSGEAVNSFTLRVPVDPKTPSTITIITPTPTNTLTPRPTLTPTPGTPTVTPTPTPTPGPDFVPRVDGRDFFVMLMGLVTALVIGYRTGAESVSRTQRVRTALAGAIGVLAGYNFFALGLPGAGLFAGLGHWAASVCVVLGATAGVAVGWFWFVYRVQDSARH